MTCLTHKPSPCRTVLPISHFYCSCGELVPGPGLVLTDWLGLVNIWLTLDRFPAVWHVSSPTAWLKDLQWNQMCQTEHFLLFNPGFYCLISLKTIYYFRKWCCTQFYWIYFVTERKFFYKLILTLVSNRTIRKNYFHRRNVACFYTFSHILSILFAKFLQ